MRRWGLRVGLGIGAALVVLAVAGLGRSIFKSFFGRGVSYPEKVLLEDFQRPLDRDLTEQLIAFERTGVSRFLDANVLKPYLDDVRTQKLLVFGVEIRADQFPDRKDLHRIVEDCAKILDIPKPRVFVADYPGTNAYAMNFADPVIVLSSSLMRRFDDPGELRFIIGHEMGHIRARHVKWKAVLSTVAEYIRRSMLIPDSVGLLPFLPLFKWAREAEMSADAAGLICCQDLKAAEAALVRLALNIDRETIGRINIDAFLQQREASGLSKYSEVMLYWHQIRQEHPFLSSRIAQLRQYSESRAYRHLWER